MTNPCAWIGGTSQVLEGSVVVILGHAAQEAVGFSHAVSVGTRSRAWNYFGDLAVAFVVSQAEEQFLYAPVACGWHVVVSWDLAVRLSNQSIASADGSWVNIGTIGVYCAVGRGHGRAESITLAIASKNAFRGCLASTVVGNGELSDAFVGGTADSSNTTWVLRSSVGATGSEVEGLLACSSVAIKSHSTLGIDDAIATS